MMSLSVSVLSVVLLAGLALGGGYGGPEESLKNFPQYVQRCCEASGRAAEYCLEEMRSSPGQRPPPAISEQDACVFLCALQDAQWVGADGRMSADTVHQLAQANPDLIPDEAATQKHVDTINGMDLSACQRAYYFARYGYYMYGYLQEKL